MLGVEGWWSLGRGRLRTEEKPIEEFPLSSSCLGSLWAADSCPCPPSPTVPAARLFSATRV